MKRTELIGKLIKEGFSEKTLVNFNDNQLKQLASRVLSEQDTDEEDVMISKKDPQFQQKVATAKKTNKTIETYESLKGNQSKIDANHNGKIDADDFAILNKEKKGEVKEGKKCEHCNKEMSKCSCNDSHLEESKPSAGLSKEKKSEVVKKAKKGGDIGKKGKGFEKVAERATKKYGSKEAGEKVAAASMWKNIQREDNEVKNWVKSLVENEEFHSFTSKNEIMELIQTKLTESETMVQHGPKVKKGHNGVPEFMTYDAIVDAEPKTAPSKPAPSTKPGTKPTPTRREDPRKTPFQPGPGPNPKPKAKIAEEKKK